MNNYEAAAADLVFIHGEDLTIFRELSLPLSHLIFIKPKIIITISRKGILRSENKSILLFVH